MTRILRLLLIAAIALPAWLGTAAETITVCKGGSSNEYVPIYGYWSDTEETESQVLYQSTLLKEDDKVLSAGQQITAITFYAATGDTVPQEMADATVLVRMGEAYVTTISSVSQMITNSNNMHEVFNGKLTIGANATEMTVTFTTPYVYQGNNLLIDFYIVKGSEDCEHSYWAGVQQSAITGWNSRYGAQQFLPKMTVTFDDGVQVVDLGTVATGSSSEPQTITVDNVSAYTVSPTPDDNGRPFTVSQSGSNFTITFSPKDPISYQGTLTVTIDGKETAILLRGYGKDSSSPSATRDEAFFRGITYEWTDSLNNTHISNLSEIATDPDQIIAMLREVYTNKSIPGNYYRSNAKNSTYDKFNDVDYSAVGTLTRGSTALTAFDDSYGWNIKPESGDILSGSIKYVNGSGNYTNYYLNPNQFKPDAEGVTLLLLEIVDTFTPPADNWTAATTHDYAKLRTLFANSIKSARIVAEAKRTGNASDYSSGTMFKIDCDKMNKFYFIAKGQLMWHRQHDANPGNINDYFNFGYPFYVSNSYVTGWLDDELSPSYLGQPAFLCHMFEQFSPSVGASQDETPAPTADLYQTFVGMETFGVKHDCPNVPYVNHHFMMYGVQSPADDCADVRDMMFFVPDYRMMNHDYRHGGNTASTNASTRTADYMNYHTEHQPIIGLYIIEQDSIHGSQVDGKDVYKLDFTWRTNLHKFLPGEDQVYYLYQVVEENGVEKYKEVYYTDADGNYTDANGQPSDERVQIKLTRSGTADDKTFSYVYVPMQESSQVVTFAVQGRDASEFLDLKMSNNQDFTIPGLNPNEMIALSDATHYSRFNVQDTTNCYSNMIRLENNAMGLNNNNINSGTHLTLTRSYTEGTTNVVDTVATITFNPSSKQLTVTMAKQSDKAAFPVGKTAVNGTKLPAGYHANGQSHNVEGNGSWTQNYRTDGAGNIWLDKYTVTSTTYPFNTTTTDYRLFIYDNFVVDVSKNNHPSSYTYKLTSNYAGSITTVYLNSAEAYDANGALWYAWTWNTANDGRWVKGVSTGESHQYKFEGVKKNMIIARMNPNGYNIPRFNESWETDDDRPVWNQTGNLTVGGENGGKNTFTFTGWLYGDWSGTNSETAYSNYFRVPVYKTDSRVNNSYSRTEIDNDTTGYMKQDPLFKFEEKVQYSSKKDILRYDAYRWAPTEDHYILDKVRADDDEDDIAPTGIAANQDGKYSVSMNKVNTETYYTTSVTVSEDSINKWAEFVDLVPGMATTGTAYTYAPVVETFSKGKDAKDNKREDYNTYGGPLQNFAVGQFQLSQVTPEQGGENALMSTHKWLGNDGKYYSYYNIRLSVDGASIPAGYEIYKIRAWREVDESVLGEEFPEFQGRVSSSYMFEDRTFPDYSKGDAISDPGQGHQVYALGSEMKTDTVTQVNLVNNQPYASPITYTLGTFGAKRVRTTEEPGTDDYNKVLDEPINVGFFARIYMTRTSNLADLNHAKGGAKAGEDEPVLPADDKYYVVEATFDTQIVPGSVPTGLVQNLNNSREVVGVKYYNMLGVESDRPFDGVNIVVTRYSDGSTTTKKILK